MDKTEAQVMAELVIYIDMKFSKYGKTVQLVLDKIEKQDEAINFMFEELNGKDRLLEEHGKKLREVVLAEKELVREVVDLHKGLIDMEEKFFEVTIVEEVERDIEEKEKKPQSTPEVQKKTIKKKVLTKDMVMDMNYAKLKKVARGKLGCTEFNKNTDWYRNFILEQPKFIKGEVII